MQQYRVNYSLLIGLVVGTLICSGAVYGIWRIQIERKSGWLISEADKAVGEKDFKNAVQLYGQYLSIHPSDRDARIKFANSNIDRTDQDDASREEFDFASQMVEITLRNPKMADMKETTELRRRLVGLYGRENVHNYSAALDHLNILLESDPKNPELQVLRATYLARSANIDEAIKSSYKIVGYDPKTDKFDVKKATAPHSIEIYSTLADLLRGKDKRELAQRVANQLVDANPNDAAALVGRSGIRARLGDAAGARADAEKAYRLKPNDLDVLLAVCNIAAQDKNFDKAREYIAAAKKLSPKNMLVYLISARLEIQQSKVDKAMAEYDEGAKAIGGAAATNLLFEKARLQIDQNDLKAARHTVDDMQRIRKLPLEILDYLDAVMLYADGKWFPASEALSKLRPRLVNYPRDIAAEVDYKLAFCYERLGRFELAQQYYQGLVKQNPGHGLAQAGVLRMQQQLGLATPDNSSDPIQKLVALELKKPKAEQNWPKVEAAVDEFAKKRPIDEATIKLFKAQIAMMREDFGRANELVVEAVKLSPKNLGIIRFQVQLARLDPKMGPAKALELLASAIKQFGDLPALRLDKADLFIALEKDKQDKEPLKHELAALLSGIPDNWTVQQKSELWTGMATKYYNMGMIDESRQYLALAADNQPNELPLRLALFSMALDAGDADGMKAAQDKILQIVGDQNDSAWLYAEARRKMWQLQRGQLNRDSLGEIRSLVNRALDQRPDWQELHALLGDVDLMSNNAVTALKHYDRAEELGRPPTAAIVRHIRLLVAYGRFADAGKLLDRIPEAARQTLLGLLYTEILFRTNQVDAALKQAQAATVADPTSAQNQFWYSQLLARSSQVQGVTEARRNEIMGQAIAAMQRAAQLQPEYAEAWFQLIRYYAMQKDENNAQKTMRDAQLALSGDNLTMFLARSYEVLGRPFDAETMYREIYETDPKDLERAQKLAAFYLGPLYHRGDRQAKVSSLINQILKAGAEGKITASDVNLLWARRQAARLLAATGDYQNLLKAENLLASNSQEGSLLIEDKLAMAEILAPRPEPVSRVKATRLLEEVNKVQPLNEADEITLAELYSNDWSEYTRHIETAIAHYPDSVRARETYARRLIARNDERSIEKAIGHVTKMRELAPDYPPTFEFIVKLAKKRTAGEQQRLLTQLRSRVPDFQSIKVFDDGQKQSLIRLANLLLELNDVDTAEKIYRELAARDPKLVYDLARFLGTYRAPEQCFEKLNEIYSVERIPQILDVAMQVARNRRDKIGDKFDAQIQRWLDAGLRENPGSISLLVVQADLYDLEKRYDDAASTYRKLLAGSDLTGIRRAVVLNNLAFLVALAKSAATDVDPMKLVQEAAQILGPNSDILDTRAVVLISRGQFKAAVQDLELSVTDSPTPAKYFHKAEAHLRAGENRAAVEAWQKAEGLGLSRDSLNRMEFDLYEQIKGEIKKLPGASVTKAEPRRKAS